MKLKKLLSSETSHFIFKSILAGLLIAVAGAIYLAVPKIITDSNIASIVGSFLFSIGLIGVIALQTNLYTGKIGYVNSKKTAIRAFWILLINLGIAFLFGLLFKVTNPTSFNSFGPESVRLNKEWYKMLFDGFICGILIYLAVELNRATKSYIPVIICVMAFILCGAEHCIADAFYLATGEITLKGLGYLGLAILGNTIGSLLIHYIQVGTEYSLDKIHR